MHVHTGTHIQHTCVHTHMLSYIHTDICSCTQTHVRMHTYALTHVDACIHAMHVYMQHSHACTRSCTHPHTHAHMHICTVQLTPRPMKRAAVSGGIMGASPIVKPGAWLSCPSLSSLRNKPHQASRILFQERKTQNHKHIKVPSANP